MSIDLDVFVDASVDGVAAVVYAVVSQESRTINNPTIPRLVLVSVHMVANLVDNGVKALEGNPIGSVNAWFDSTVALHWITCENRYKQFVSNRVAKLKEKDYILWRYVPSEQDTADIASRGCDLKKLTDEWYRGADWLHDQTA